MAVWRESILLRWESISRFSLLCLYHMGYLTRAKLVLWNHPKIKIYVESPEMSANFNLRQGACIKTHPQKGTVVVGSMLPLKHPLPIHASLTSLLSSGDLRKVKGTVKTVVHKTIRLVTNLPCPGSIFYSNIDFLLGFSVTFLLWNNGDNVWCYFTVNTWQISCINTTFIFSLGEVIVELRTF